MLPYTKLKMSLRLPPTLDAAQAAQRLETILTRSPPQGARVSFERVSTGNGWHAPLEADWLNEAVANVASSVGLDSNRGRGEYSSVATYDDDDDDYRRGPRR